MANNGSRFFLVSAVGILAGSPLAHAQTRLFPSAEPFEYPLGASRSSGVTGRLISERRLESLFGAEREADVSIGENVPVLALSRSPRPSFLGLTIRVLGRFSLDDPKTALISNDWVVGVHGVVDRGPWRVVGELYHESSHLGDEYAERFSSVGVRRLDWTREVASVWVRRSIGPVALHLVTSYNLVDQFRLPRGALGFGVDYRSGRGVVRPVAGVYAESVQYGGWKVTTTARGGVEFQGAQGKVALGLVYLNGLSQQRQFFRRQSRYYGFELRFDF